jgi:hypothetical protein
MAGSLVSDFAIGDSNIDNVMLSLNKAYKGQMSLSLTEFDTSTIPKIEAGSWTDNNGALYKFDSDESISTTDPATSSTVANGIVFVCLIPQIGTASGATTDATGYAAGSTTITLASAGTGSILIGDRVQFSGDDRKYTVTSGDADVSGGGSIIIESPGLIQAIPATATAITLTAGGVTAAFTATAPTWSGSKQGFYGAGALSNYRHIARCQKYYDGYSTYYTAKQILNSETIEYRLEIKQDKMWNMVDNFNSYAFVWSPELALVCSAYNNEIRTSTDGITWTSRTTPTGSWISGCWSAELGLFCLSNSLVSSTGIATSTDGITWTSRTTPTYQYRDVCWSPELSLFCAVGSGVVTSSDGITWSDASFPGSTLYAVCWSPELSLFCAVDNNSTNFYTSPNGTAWTLRTAPSVEYWDSILWSYSEGLFVASSNQQSSTGIATSTDGITWTSSYHPTVKTCSSLSWSPELNFFLTCGNNIDPELLISSDGVYWSQKPPFDDSYSIDALVWIPELMKFIAGSSSGGIFTSNYGAI